MHRLEDRILITPAMLRRFHDEAMLEGGNGSYVSFVQIQNGEFVVGSSAAQFAIAPDQAIFAQDMLTALNRHLHHDGAWVMVFTHPMPSRTAAEIPEFGRFGLMWVDADGDIQFTAEWMAGTGTERDFTDVLMSGPDSWINRCETAWNTWHLYMRKVLAPAPHQLVKAAQGQTHH